MSVLVFIFLAHQILSRHFGLTPGTLHIALLPFKGAVSRVFFGLFYFINRTNVNHLQIISFSQRCAQKRTPRCIINSAESDSALCNTALANTERCLTTL